MLQLEKQFSGILTCSRYAFRPNKLNYCGPDQNKELLEYLKAGEADGGLELILKKFETLYPYLKLIARANKVSDPFDKKVSDAYWIGSEMLLNSGPAELYYHLADSLNLKKKLSRREVDDLKHKMAHGANPHHSFHVFNVWQRTGHVENPHTLFTMDECRIGWGKVKMVAQNIITVIYEPLVLNNGRLEFGAPTAKNIFYELPYFARPSHPPSPRATEGRSKATERHGKASQDGRNEAVAPGDWISFHWSSFCEVLSLPDLENLKKWTSINLELANLK